MNINEKLRILGDKHLGEWLKTRKEVEKYGKQK